MQLVDLCRPDSLVTTTLTSCTGLERFQTDVRDPLRSQHVARTDGRFRGRGEERVLRDDD